MLRTRKRPGPCDSLPPYKLVSIPSCSQHVPVILHSPVLTSPYKRLRRTAGASAASQGNRLQPRMLFQPDSLGIQTGQSSVQEQHQWQQQQRLLLRHTLQQTVAALKQDLSQDSSQASFALSVVSVCCAVPCCAVLCRAAPCCACSFYCCASLNLQLSLLCKSENPCPNQ